MNTIEQAIQCWKEAKHNETTARESRLVIEESIARLKNLELGSNNLGELTVKVSNKEEWDTVSIPTEMLDKYFNEVVTMKPDAKRIKDLQRSNPKAWMELKEHLTLTPKNHRQTNYTYRHEQSN